MYVSGMIGVHFEVMLEKVLGPFMETAVRVFFDGVNNVMQRDEKAGTRSSLSYSLSCKDIDSDYRWNAGKNFFARLKESRTKSINREAEPLFKKDGSLVKAELKVMNFRQANDKRSKFRSGGNWEEVGEWNTWTGLDIKDIVWPGNSHFPPPGVPEKFHLKITFLEEPPFIFTLEPDPISGECSINRGVPCYVEPEMKCCSGLCIDLLQKFESELGFSYDLIRVRDGKFGTTEHGRWNGLMRELVDKNTDVVLSSLKVNKQREAAVDFSVPFLESGIAISVVKKTGIISPTAFLEPFDFASWMLVALVAIQAAAAAIFLFEFFSPYGYDMKVKSHAVDIG